MTSAPSQRPDENNAIPFPAGNRLLKRRATDLSTREEALERLRSMASAHPFWSNRLLVAARAGHLTADDFRYVFSQYYLYSKNFTRALAALMAKCEDDLFRSRLSENLWEEGGGQVLEKRHAELFRRFLVDGLGLELDRIEFSDATRYFQHEFLDFCMRASPLSGAAFLSLGTEGIVPRLYRTLVDGLLEAGVPEDKLEFFKIHIACDDGHAQVLEQMMLAHFDEPEWFNTCHRALDAALTLRLRFFEGLYEAIETRRVSGILEQINARESLTPMFAEGTSMLKSSPSARRRMYSNKNERLNIDFEVDAVPFSCEVLDPRLVRIPPGKFNEHHKHAHETVFVIVTGTGQVLVDDLKLKVKAGDYVFVPRWAMHQSQNLGDTEMVILAVTDFNLTRKAYIGDYLKTARMKRSTAKNLTRDARWDLGTVTQGNDEAGPAEG